MVERDTEKKTVQLIANLKSSQTELIMHSLSEIKVKGNKHIVPALIDVIMQNQETAVSKKALEVLCDIKDQSAVSHIVEGIEKYRHHEQLNKLVSACWQSGLNFSEHLDLFSHLVFEHDYYTAIESFTVIEENIASLSLKKREHLKNSILAMDQPSSREKKRLISELLDVVGRISGPFRIDDETLN